MAGDNAARMKSVLQLTDDELLEQLQEHGFNGPIVDSTRSVYQKKLIQILEGGYVASPENDDSEEGNDRSFPEESLRHRVHQPSPLANSSYQPSSSSYLADNDEDVQPVHKPSPPRPTSFSSNSSFLSSSGSPYNVTSRPSLASVSGKGTTYRSLTPPPQLATQPKAKASNNSSSLFSKAKLVIVVIVAIFLAFVFYQNMESSQDNNPVPKIG